MTSLQQILSPLRKAVDDFKMISPGDKIAVGLSGGKDSVTLLEGLAALRRFYPNPFEVVAIRIDTGLNFNKDEECALEEFCASLGVEYYVEKTQIAEIVFNERKEKSPCSLCANMRRGALNQAAKKLGCNKVALGHHRDDLIETFFLSMTYEGRLSTFQPVTYLDKADLTIIRPMLYVKESMVLSFAKNKPILFNPCPVDKHTQREEIKTTIRELNDKYPTFKENLFRALIHEERQNLIKKPKD